MKATQLPFVLNFATTGHKLQGASVDNIFIHNWNKTNNWAYVVLSRVRTREGLFLRMPLRDEDLKMFEMPREMTGFLASFRERQPPYFSRGQPSYPDVLDDDIRELRW
jgi:hypothetical protein